MALWDLYPKKAGMSSVSKKAKAALYKAGFDVVAAAIENYKAQIHRENRDMQYVKNGSTFFNGAWEEFVHPEETAETLPQAPRRKSL